MLCHNATFFGALFASLLLPAIDPIDGCCLRGEPRRWLERGLRLGSAQMKVRGTQTNTAVLEVGKERF